LTQGQDVLSLRKRLGRLVLVPAVHDVTHCLRRLSAQLARHGGILISALRKCHLEGLTLALLLLLLLLLSILSTDQLAVFQTSLASQQAKQAASVTVGAKLFPAKSAAN
jgi:hypothetical protein